MIYKTRTKLLLDNDSLTSKVDFGSKNKYRELDQPYFVLYKTTCLVTDQIYIGIRTTKDFEKDTYIGNGVTYKKYLDKEFVVTKNNLFIQSVVKYGYDQFLRVPLMYFSSREDALRAERIIVDEEFISDDRVLNTNIGGDAPPRRVGRDNGNYGRRWSEEKKKWLRDYLKDNRNTKGSNNPRAIPVIVIDIFSKPVEIFRFGCTLDCDKFFKTAKCTTAKFLILQEGHLYKGRYLAAYEEDFKTKWTIEEFVDKYSQEISIRCRRIYYEIIHNFNFCISEKEYQYLSKKYLADLAERLTKKRLKGYFKFLFNDCCKKYKKGDQGEGYCRLSP